MGQTRFNRRLRHLVDAIHRGNVKEASRESGIPQPTLHALYNAVASKPRRKTLKKLVEFYGVSEEWLLGERGVLRQPDYRRPAEAVEGVPDGEGWVDLPDLWDRALFYWRRFETRCYKAWVADRDAGKAVPDWRAVWRSFRAMLMSRSERGMLRARTKRTKGKWQLPGPAEDEEIVPASVRRFEAVWGPWFEGKADLDYESLLRRAEGELEWTHAVEERSDDDPFEIHVVR